MKLQRMRNRTFYGYCDFCHIVNTRLRLAFCFGRPTPATQLKIQKYYNLLKVPKVKVLLMQGLHMVDSLRYLMYENASYSCTSHHTFYMQNLDLTSNW